MYFEQQLVSSAPATARSRWLDGGSWSLKRFSADDWNKYYAIAAKLIKEYKCLGQLAIKRRCVLSKIILSVEDNNAAYRLLECAFANLNIDARLYRTKDGEEALRFLRKQTPFTDAPKPHLVLLNLNMPRMGGLDVLAEIRADEHLHDTPAVVFSSSELDSDRARCLALGAREFVNKPQDLDSFLKAVTTACKYASA